MTASQLTCDKSGMGCRRKNAAHGEAVGIRWEAAQPQRGEDRLRHSHLHAQGRPRYANVDTSH